MILVGGCAHTRTRRRIAEEAGAASSNSSTSTHNTPAAAPSRHNARNPSRSTGSQHSQDSSTSIYNLEYRRSRNESSMTGGGTNLNTARLNPRICICDQHMFPTDCSECDIANNNNCERHSIVNCIQPDCAKKFHKECLCSGVFTDANLELLSQQHVCMECKCKLSVGDAEDTPFASLSSDATDSEAVSEKLCRFGLAHDLFMARNLEEEQAAMQVGRKKMDKLWKALQECNSCLPAALANDGNDILDSKPRAYPCPVGISDESVNKHVQYGRRAELSMLLYSVRQCGCCGSVQPYHSDPDFPSSAPLYRMHLINQTHKAWHCTCAKVHSFTVGHDTR
mmetsp:Transcript_2312/g.3704  ORF Transcript_2312/g.3704 Transcript_2312/m.3704 type:complete len:338 (-) Transcript_2312:500-1513(-)